MELNQLLARVTRRISMVPYGIRLADLLRRHYTPRFSGRPDAWTVIDDFDGALRLRVDRSAYLGALLYWRGYQTSGEIRLLRRILRPDMVFADVGANQGEYTVLAARRLSRGAVLAFEPVPAIYANLAANLRLNGFRNVLPFNFGLFDRAAALPMYTSDDTVIHGSFNEGLASVFASDYRRDAVAELQFLTLDEVFPKLGLARLDLLKIDVEGAELPVLRGAAETIGRLHPRLILEVNEPAFAAAGYAVADLLAFLRQHGYRMAVIDHRGHTAPVAPEAMPPLGNLLCE